MEREKHWFMIIIASLLLQLILSERCSLLFLLWEVD